MWGAELKQKTEQEFLEEIFHIRQENQCASKLIMRGKDV